MPRSKFTPPTAAEVAAYAAEIQYKDLNPDQFLDHYEMVGWVVGKTRTPMKSWKAAVRTWKRNADLWAAENPSQKPAPTRAQALQQIDERHLKEYAENIAACRSWKNNPDGCPFGDPHDAERTLWRKAHDHFGQTFCAKLKSRIQAQPQRSQA